MSDADVTRTEVRGRCDEGHVLIAEVFGPALPESWMCACPLPDCGFPIMWEHRPGWLTSPDPIAGIAQRLQSLAASMTEYADEVAVQELADAVGALSQSGS